MFIFLYGPDTYRLTEKSKEIISQYQKFYPGSLNLKYFDTEENSYEEFEKEISQLSFFKERKLIVLKNLFSNPEFKKKFLKKVEEFSKTSEIILILEKKEISEKKKEVQLLKKYNHQFQKFDFLNEKELEKWIKERFLKFGVNIELKALKKLLELENQDLWRLNNEIEKLVNYKNGQQITETDIDLLGEQKIETDIFKTIESLARKEKNLAFYLIQKHLQKGDDPLYLFSMINFQFRNLLILKSFQSEKGYNISLLIISKFLNLHPYVIKKTLPLIKSFNLEELKRIYQKLFEIDIEIKTGKISSTDALKIFISEI